MNNNYNVPAEYKPISAWGYFGYQILFAIPLIGFICLIIFALSASNRNLKNFARSYFCSLLLAIILVIIILVLGVLFGAM